ncbi:hypothetical protein Q9Q94_15410 [Uliginosibacterium sp. 31-16]|uniref:nitric oxide reductase activation protein NorD n=1 Tax=Uliginosibacterium sp. 31-16 TaxID=3068315 RepID=UPI00273FC8CC|nr:VWA domain-containing protein [Uliginosibacterium sp. 31-16]MDP5240929.1 hypothetical protein [Uliginosibacterium sp. 31-16]
MWRKHRAARETPLVSLADLRRQNELLVHAVFGRSFSIKRAQPPAPPTFFKRMLQRARSIPRGGLPATDGVAIFLPADAGTTDVALGAARYRVACLRQAMRLVRGSAACHPDLSSPLTSGIYLLLEANSADHCLVTMLPGLADELAAMRSESLQFRSSLTPRDSAARLLEDFACTLLASPVGGSARQGICTTPADSLQESCRLGEAWMRNIGSSSRTAVHLLKDWWTGELLQPEPGARTLQSNVPEAPDAQAANRPSRSAQLARRPRVRDAGEAQDEKPGAFMVQTSQPHEHAEDPYGMNRPMDRDDETPLNDFGESLSELSEAQLVRTMQTTKDCFISDELPSALRPEMAPDRPRPVPEVLEYPEWDYRLGAYRPSGAIVHSATALPGPDEWVRKTLSAHSAALMAIRRRFEMLRAEPVRLRRQLDGDEIDVEACLDRFADLRSGHAPEYGLYENRRRQDRDIAVSLLIDVSGSTDAWVSGRHRVIDVAREALLLVSIALERTDVRYAVQAFSGESRQGVVVREIKRFDELHGPAIAQRIAGLEPEHSTRAGTALRHATAGLMKQASAHRLLLLLSDGRPNDVDEYEGRYGLEDTRQAVVEATMQGVSVFCLTIDQSHRDYLPRIFGRDYAMIREPARLPAVLLDWMKALISR